MKVQLDQIKQNPYNTREDYGDLTGLKKSIKKFGLTQPFLSRKTDEGYEIAFGSRRYEALKGLGYKEVDIEIRDISSSDMAILSLCENVHRKDLNAVELASAYRRGLDTTKLQLDDFAETIGENKSKIKDYLTILDLPKEILKTPNKYSKGQFIALGKLNQLNKGVRIMFENQISNVSLSTHFVEQIVNSCESIFACGLPERKKKDLCWEIIRHDYSALSPDNYKDIRTLSDSLLKGAIEKYQQNLNKYNIKPGRKQRGNRSSLRTIKDIIHLDKKLDDVTLRVSETGANIQKAIQRNYYSNASKRSQKKFKTAVNHLVSGIEKILQNG